MEGNKGWSVQRSSSLPSSWFSSAPGTALHWLQFHRAYPSDLALFSVGCSVDICSRMELLLLCWSWCSLCCISLLLFPPLPVCLFLPFFTCIALEIPPALLMDSAEFCSGSMAELLPSFPRGHLCRSLACHPSPWGPQQCRWGWLEGSYWGQLFVHGITCLVRPWLWDLSSAILSPIFVLVIANNFVSSEKKMALIIFPVHFVHLL